MVGVCLATNRMGGPQNLMIGWSCFRIASFSTSWHWRSRNHLPDLNVDFNCYFSRIPIMYCKAGLLHCGPLVLFVAYMFYVSYISSCVDHMPNFRRSYFQISPFVFPLFTARMSNVLPTGFWQIRKIRARQINQQAKDGRWKVIENHLTNSSPIFESKQFLSGNIIWKS